MTSSTTTITTAPRKPWVAAFLSLLTIGVGQIYCGRIVPGVLLFATWLVFLPLVATLAWIEPSNAALLGLLVVPFVLQVLLHLGAATAAYLTAKRSSADYRPRDYNRPLVYAVLVLLGLSYPVLLGATLRDHLYQAYVVPTSSMVPTIAPGERILCNRLRFEQRPIRRGDLVVFVPPHDPSMRHVSRVVGLAGDQVALEDGQLVINGQPVPTQPVDAGFSETVAGYRYETSFRGERTAVDHPPTRVPDRQLFVLGDQRDNSRDSRFFGGVPLANVLGRVEYRFLPATPSRFGVLR